MNRLRIVYQGRVQGVGFRATVAGIAASRPIGGTVCNVSDGSVELIAEGPEADLIEFRDEISHRLERNIVSRQEHWEDLALPSFEGFRIVADKLSTR